MIFTAGAKLFVLCEPCAVDLFDLEEDIQIDAFGIIDPDGGIGSGHDLCAELLGLLDRILRNIAGTGNRYGHSGKIHAVTL